MSGKAKAAQAPKNSEQHQKNGSSSTPLGRVVTAVVALGLIAIIIGVAAAVVQYGDSAPSGSGTVNMDTGLTGTSGSSATTVAVESSTATAAAELPNSAVFTFRDIFDPLIEPVVEEPTSTTGGQDGSNEDTVTPVSAATLYLQNITTVDSTRYAVLLLDGETYTLAVGEEIPGTPWEVLKIGSSSVTMLYGDVQVVLAVGQGISK